MSFIANRLSSIQPSPTLAITALANSLAAEGKDVVGFGAGEPDFDTPRHIKDAAIDALNKGFTRYIDVAGLKSLRELIAQKFARDNGFHFTIDEIVVSTGGKQALYNAFLATINPGDEVIIPTPYWVSYADMVALAEGTPVFVHAMYENEFRMQPQELEAAITPRTRAIILNSPSNPTGSVYTKEEFQKLGEVLEKHPNILIFTDDIYEKILYDGIEFTNIAMAVPALLDRTIVFNGFSKAYAMTGWRLGYAASKRKEIIKAMNTIQGQSTSNATTFAQKGAEAALTGDQGVITEMVKHFRERRDYIVQALRQMPGIRLHNPGGAFYVFPDISELAKTDGFGRLMAANPDEKDSGKLLAKVLLEKYLVALVPGIAFGYSRGFRLSYALGMKEIQKGMERIGEFVNSL